ncbi:MAG: ABC transporter ATP-binding protein [Armatimonadetes bacterium]|nr:ABC transporter ATP-binding protein [Armatimonadota bacterium]
MSVAEIRGLTVKYGQFTAVDNFDLTLPEGCVGLLGPNGAGKTTFLKTLLGFITPAAGGGTVLGMDIATQGAAIRQQIGYMPEQDCHIPGNTAVQFVSYAGELAGLPHNRALQRAHEVLEYCGLGEARYRNVETYSTGMKQRIKLAQALVHGPKLLLLDEPTNGLDPRGREEMLSLVRDISTKKGLSVLVCSHLLPDIERTCEEVIVLLGGKLQAQGPIRDLKSMTGEPLDVELRETSGEFLMRADQLGLRLLHTKGSVYRLQGEGTRLENCRSVYEAAKRSQSQVRAVRLAERSLEEAFLEVVGG